MYKPSLLLTLLFLPLIALAGPVSQEEALKKAKQFVSGNTTNLNGPKRVFANGKTLKLATAKDRAYYIYNIGQKNGYVVVSGSDRTQPILGYADKGQFDKANVPEALQAWLLQLQQAVENVDRGLAQERDLKPALRKASAATYTAKNAIAPMVSCHWNQGDPYNQQTPDYVNEEGETVAHSATGCVATAMAQIMYYWKWPEGACKSIPSYQTSWGGRTRTIPGLDPVVFKWDKMDDDYNDNSTQEAKDAVAELMLYVGESVNMGYGASSGAGVGNPPNALKNYFDYNPDMYYTSHDQYTYRQWEDLIYNELVHGRPVLMNGDNYERTGGHEWVCDGYDGNGLFHMNWGWGGMSDGYFVLTVMVPDQQGIGGSTASDGYSMGQGIVVGLKPSYVADDEDEEPVCLNILNVSAFSDKYKRAAGNNRYIPLKFTFGNPFHSAYYFDVLLSVYDENGNIAKESAAKLNSISINGMGMTDRTVSVNVGGLDDGTYKLKVLSRKTGDETYIMAQDADAAYARLTLRGDSIFVEAYPGDPQIQVNSFELVGASKIGEEQKVRVNITNNGGDYYSDSYLCVDSAFSTPVSGNTIHIPANTTMDIYYKYKPSSYGYHYFALEEDKWNPKPFYETRYNVTEGTIPSLGVVIKPANSVEDDKLYGNSITLNVRLVNTSDVPYVNTVEASAWEVSGGYYWKRQGSSQDVVIPAQTTKTLTFTLSDLNYGSRYNFHVDCKGSKSGNYGDLTITDGAIIVYNLDGSQVGYPSSAKPTIDTNTAAIYLPGTPTPANMSLAEEVNPNVLVYMDKGAKIGSRMKRIWDRKLHNYIYGLEAEDIIVSDDGGFYVPQAFTAEKITYSRAIDANQTTANGWSTLTLPFQPESVTAEGTAVDWFRNKADEGKDFILQEFVSITADKLKFADVEKFVPNRPYLLQTTGVRAGNTFSLAGKSLEFSAEYVNVETTSPSSTYTPEYKFVGTLGSDTVENAYVLSTDGTAFAKNSGQSTIAPFRAYFLPVSDSTYEALYIQRETATGIVGVSVDEISPETPVYNLQGIKVAVMSEFHTLPSGIYLVGSRKVVK